MRKYYSLLLIFLTVLAFPVNAQFNAEEDIARGELYWTKDIQVSPSEFLLNFDGAVNQDDYGLLPVLQISLNVPSGKMVTKAVLTEASYQKLETADLHGYPDMDLISDEPKLILKFHSDRKQEVQSLFLLPLRKSESGLGFERLVTYTIQLEYGAKQAPAGRASTNRNAMHSVLRSGSWYRIGVTETGVYKLTSGDLEAMGITVANLDPRKIRIFGNGGGMLEEAISLPRPDDLIENSIYVAGESDGNFDPDDYILFYGESPVKISFNAFFLKYEHEVNFYSDTTYYFVNVGTENGKRVVPAATISQEPTNLVTSFQDIFFHEKDAVNLIKSGQIWYGEVFNTQLQYDFTFDIPHLDITQPVYLKASLVGRSTQNTEFNLIADGEVIESIDVPSIVLGNSIYARALTSNYEEFYAKGDEVTIGVNFVKPGVNDLGWLNYIELNCIRSLIFDGGQMSFRDMRSTGPGNVSRFELSTQKNSTTIWNVTNQASITSQILENIPGGYAFKTSADSLEEFIAFDGSSYLKPTFIEKVENQDLHNLEPVDFVIITYPAFMAQAQRLADFHRQHDGMTVHILTPQQIYNEFSSGAQDVSAIRDFMKMLYDRNGVGSRPMYLLLFGDASYDFKDYLQTDNNMVPAYQSRESLKMAASFVTDDYFGCLDYDEGSNGSGTVDIGVGRFPVHTMEQAVQAVDKVIGYAGTTPENFGPWRNQICFVGDDEDNNIHLNQAEGLSVIADSLGPDFNVNKIYLDAYAQLQTPSGIRYPEVNLAINNEVNSGCLLMNYTGHGGEVGWAEERVLDIPAIQAFKNISNLPAFVTATCEFSRYDDPGLVSAGELVFLNPNGAGIGLFTTTRLAYSQSNYSLNKRFYYEAFRIDSLTGDYPRMGDLIRVSKTPSNQNIKNFVLLGDPALMLAYPKMKVNTLEILNEMEGRPADTIHALSKVTVKGQVEDLYGNKLSNFNGILYSTLFDKPVVYKTRGNDPQSKVTSFEVQDKVLFRGQSTIVNGDFEFSFIVPKDISYEFGDGKLSYYAVDTNIYLDANGCRNVIIGGADNEVVVDETGPVIDLYLNHLEFRSGDITTPSPMLIAKLFDESGINTVGNGIGHDIVAVIDGEYKTSVILNDKFNPETDSFQGGEIFYQLGPFGNGKHTLSLKAWDVYNNSSEKTIEFVVNAGEQLVITGVHVQPNPFSENTEFVFEYNKPGVKMDVTVQIFNIAGIPVNQFIYSFNTESLEAVPYYWDGRNESGVELPSGLYVYTLTVKSADGFISKVSQKLMICK